MLPGVILRNHNFWQRLLRLKAFLKGTEMVKTVKKVQVAMVRKRQNQKDIPTPKTEVGKTKLTISYLYLENIL